MKHESVQIMNFVLFQQRFTSHLVSQSIGTADTLVQVSGHLENHLKGKHNVIYRTVR